MIYTRAILQHSPPEWLLEAYFPRCYRHYLGGGGGGPRQGRLPTSRGPLHSCAGSNNVMLWCTHSVDFVTFFQSFSPATGFLICCRTFRLEPHTLHLVQILHGRYAFLQQENENSRTKKQTKKKPQPSDYYSEICRNTKNVKFIIVIVITQKRTGWLISFCLKRNKDSRFQKHKTFG